jgi:hypothetical protein
MVRDSLHRKIYYVFNIYLFGIGDFKFPRSFFFNSELAVCISLLIEPHGCEEAK